MASPFGSAAVCMALCVAVCIAVSRCCSVCCSVCCTMCCSVYCSVTMLQCVLQCVLQCILPQRVVAVAERYARYSRKHERDSKATRHFLPCSIDLWLSGWLGACVCVCCCACVYVCVCVCSTYKSLASCVVVVAERYRRYSAKHSGREN